MGQREDVYVAPLGWRIKRKLEFIWTWRIRRPVRAFIHRTLRRDEHGRPVRKIDGAWRVDVNCGECGTPLGWVEHEHRNHFYDTHCTRCVREIKGWYNEGDI